IRCGPLVIFGLWPAPRLMRRAARLVSRECLLQLRPVFELVLASERVLHIAQDGVGWAIAICSFKASAGLSVASAQCFEPAFGLFSQIVESGSCGELSGHNLPSVLAQVRLAQGRMKGPCQMQIEDWVGASSLAADRRRPRAR